MCELIDRLQIFPAPCTSSRTPDKMSEPLQTPSGCPETDIMASVAQASSSTASAGEILEQATSSAPDTSRAANGSNDPTSSMPSVSLHIPYETAPGELHFGLRELARQHIRTGRLKFCERPGHGWMGAGGQRDHRSGKGAKGEWWWNVS